ncbi:MAG: hypothetical protein ACOY3J_11715 [Bacillota bacterium]
MAVTIAVMSYRGLTSLIESLDFNPPPEVKIKIFDALLEDALQIAKSLEEKKEVDVFVSAGANGLPGSKERPFSMPKVIPPS